MASTQFLFDGPKDVPVQLVLAHGAGAPMDSPFMAQIAAGLGDLGLRVARFEFPYMAGARATGKKRPPDRAPVLLESWRSAVAELAETTKTPDLAANLAIGGKSLGGRMASLVADELGVRALVCLGYPFHPPGKPDRLRTEHLEAMTTRALILQGERDPFGTVDDVAGYDLSDTIRVDWLPDGDHSFKPRVRSGHTEEGNLERAIEKTVGFVLTD